MGKFKNYLITEELGLGDIGKKIDSFYHNQWLKNQISNLFSTPIPEPTLPLDTQANAGTELGDRVVSIPSVEKTGRITNLFLKKNPIYIRLSDGTEAYFSYDEYKKIQGTPEVGKNMTIIFQRHPQDYTKQTSKIDKAIVLD